MVANKTILFDKIALLSNYHFSLDLNLKGNLNFIYISFISIQIEFEYGVFIAEGGNEMRLFNGINA